MLTTQDLEQITEVVAAAVNASEQRIIARQDRAVESIATEISVLRGEMNSQFERVYDRFDSIDRRGDRLAEDVTGIHGQIAGINTEFKGMSRWADSLDSSNSKIHETLQRYDRRIADLERAIRPQQQH